MELNPNRPSPRLVVDVLFSPRHQVSFEMKLDEMYLNLGRGDFILFTECSMLNMTRRWGICAMIDGLNQTLPWLMSFILYAPQTDIKALLGEAWILKL